MEIQKIIWASDGSVESNEALQYTELFSNIYGSHVIGLGVFKPLNLDNIKLTPEIKNELFQIRSEHEKREHDRIQDALSKVCLDGNFSIRFETGMPHQVILKIAEEEKVDLIVMGKRGLGLLDRITIGSTSLKVLRNSKIPVICVKKRDGGRRVDINNILVPLDIAENIDSALTFATELAAKLNAKLSVVNVFWIDSQIYDIPPQLVDDLIARSTIQLRERVKKIQNEKNGIETRMEVLHGFNPAITLADYANVNEFDLIVINTHGRRGVKRLFMGSVTEKIIQESNCPVLTIRP